MSLINGFTTSFTEGLSGPATLYLLTLQIIGPGSAEVSVSPAAAPGFAAGTPQGLKVGHTDSNGNPSSSSYPASLAVTATVRGDIDGDGDVDFDDLDVLVAVLLGSPLDPDHVLRSDLNDDGMADGGDIQSFVDILTSQGAASRRQGREGSPPTRSLDERCAYGVRGDDSGISVWQHTSALGASNSMSGPGAKAGVFTAETAVPKPILLDARGLGSW
jgi:hypothetical protein